MSKYYDRFIELLEEMFQFSNEDLDFGIYRIMNQKREEIRNFLETGLLPQVKQAFQKYQSADQSQLRKDLEQMRQSLEAAGVPPESAPKYISLKEQLSKSLDLNVLESEVFSDLTSFFRRYYNNGDFVSNRRYKKDVYSIPYEGEEVKLHWANADQYYVKTTENFRNYSFELPSKRKVHFTLVEASTEQNNNKEQEGKERQFILTEDQPLEEIGGELFIRFEYRSMDDKVKREALNTQSIDRISQLTDFQGWLQELQKPHDKNPNKTILEKHLNDYTASNKFDYFIHKDLGGFLRRELDFFIKNEIMHLDDLDTENEARIEQYLSKIKVIKSMGHKIIAFLEQIENFQKKLWLKKKFVVDTQYCVTLDRVPEELYSEIATNEAQLDEWIRLFAIDEIAGDLTSPGFSSPLTVEFLKANPFLVLDTSFFDQVFKDKLLMSIEDLDGNMDGLLIHSENFQALNLLQQRYNKRVKSVYIDPPYNTSEETFLYKNLFKHSSWVSMMSDRTVLIKKLMSEDGILQVTIDDEELNRLKLMLDSKWGMDKYIGTVIIQSNPRGRGINSFYATSHEYCLTYANDPIKARIIDQPLTEDQEGDYKYSDEVSDYRLLPFRRSGGLSTPDERPNSEFTLYYSNKESKIIAVGGERLERYPALYEPAYICMLDHNRSEIQQLTVDEFYSRYSRDDIVEIKPIDSEGQRRVWRWSDREKILQAASTGEFVVQLKEGQSVVQLKDRIKEGRKPKTIWFDSKYDSSSHGTNLLQDILGKRRSFGYPKSIYSTYDALYCVVGKDKEAIVLDCFGGSGTTAHAVISMNSADSGNRKYVLAEMGSYFDAVTKTRIQKVIYSKDWKDGKPVSREGSSHMFKYIRLESYEDTLNNLSLKRSKPQQMALDRMEAEAKEQYLLSYMLDLESKGSASLIDLTQFENPFEYKLKIVQNNQTQVATIDLVETFNYLLGIVVKQVEAIQGFKVVRGLLPSGENVLIIWRNLKEKSNEDLEAFFKKQRYSTLDTEFDRIYVNGDNHLENLKQDEDRWKVILIEEEFQRLMFDVADV